MQLTALVFYPQSPFRGEITTNTLFGAICWGIRKFYGEGDLKEFLKRFEEKDPPFVFSSPLPIGRSGNVWFPRPPLEGSILDGLDREGLKDIYPLNKVFKKISLIEWDILEKILRKEIETERELFEEILRKIKGKLKEEKDFKKLLEAYQKSIPGLKKESLTVKTPINRLTNTAKEGELHNEVIHIYNPFAVFVKVKDDEWFEKAKVALKVVRLGGNKTVGLGRFTFEEKRDIIPEGLTDFVKERFEGGEEVYTLSPVFDDGNINLEESLYEVRVERSAVDKSPGYFDRRFIDLPLWKKAIVYLREGSILKVKNPSEVLGGLKTTLEWKELNIYSYGFGFGLTLGGKR